MKTSEIKEKYKLPDTHHFILEKLIYTYMKHLFDPKTNIEYKKRTISEILFDLEKFDRYLCIAYPGLTSVEQIEIRHIDSFKHFCREELLNTPDTVNKKIRAIRHFFDFMKHNNVHALTNYRLNHNVALEVDYLKENIERLPVYIPKGKLNLIINILHKYKYGIRDVSITLLLALLGLKLDEIFNLKINNVNLKSKELSVLRDGTNTIFPIAGKLNVHLREYLLLRDSLSNGNSYKYLFMSHTGNQYSIRSYQYKFKLAVIEADFNVCYTPRNVRASFCYYMANNTDKTVLKKILNQEKVNQYYAEAVKNNPLLL